MKKFMHIQILGLKETISASSYKIIPCSRYVHAMDFFYDKKNVFIQICWIALMSNNTELDIEVNVKNELGITKTFNTVTPLQTTTKIITFDSLCVKLELQSDMKALLYSVYQLAIEHLFPSPSLSSADTLNPEEQEWIVVATS